MLSDLDTKLNLIKVALYGVNSIWLVGGAARNKIGMTDKEVKDIDIIVPNEFADRLNKQVLQQIADEHTAWVFNNYNYFGGLKLKYVNEFEGLNFDVDVWTGDVGEYLAKVPTAWDGVAINLNTGAVLRTLESLGPNRMITERQTVKKMSHGFREHCLRQGLLIDPICDMVF